MKELNQIQIQEVAGGTTSSNIFLADAGNGKDGGAFLIPEFSNKPTPLDLESSVFI